MRAHADALVAVADHSLLCPVHIILARRPAAYEAAYLLRDGGRWPGCYSRSLLGNSDAVRSHTPFIVPRSSTHGAFVNSQASRQAGPRLLSCTNIRLRRRHILSVYGLRKPLL